MEVHRLEREFVYSGVKLPDTSPVMTPEQVRDTYVHLYPVATHRAPRALSQVSVVYVSGRDSKGRRAVVDS